MTNKHTAREAFDHAFTDGREACVEFMRTTTWGMENYGADADGRRGMMIVTIDDDRAEDIYVTWYGDGPDGGRPATPFAALDGMTQLMVTAAVEDYLASHEATAPEEPEADWDDIGD